MTTGVLVKIRAKQSPTTGLERYTQISKFGSISVIKNKWYSYIENLTSRPAKSSQWDASHELRITAKVSECVQAVSNLILCVRPGLYIMQRTSLKRWSVRRKITD